MNTRSQGNHNLIPVDIDIARVQRELRAQRRNQNQHIAMDPQGEVVEENIQVPPGNQNNGNLLGQEGGEQNIPHPAQPVRNMQPQEPVRQAEFAEPAGQAPAGYYQPNGQQYQGVFPQQRMPAQQGIPYQQDQGYQGPPHQNFYNEHGHQGHYVHPNAQGYNAGFENFRPPNIYPPPPPNRGRAIGAGDTPRAHVNIYGIVPPPHERNEFVPPGILMQSIESKPFSGLRGQNPIKHTERFEKYCNLYKTPGVSDDVIRLQLFPFSLTGKAQRWEEQILSASITTWQQCKDAFLAKFYPSHVTASMRHEISNFQQDPSEEFADALERFRLAISECRHHGFTEETLLTTFYRGVLPSVQQFLDGASNGNFLSRDVESGWELLENTAVSFSQSSYYRKNKDNQPNSRKELKAVHDKLDLILSGKVKTKGPIIMDPEENEEEIFDEHNEDVNFIQGNNQRFQGNFNNGYRQNQSGYNNQFQGTNSNQYQGSYNQGSYGNYRQNNYPQNNFRNNSTAVTQDTVYPQKQQVPQQPVYNKQAPPGFQQQQVQQPAQQQQVTQTPDLTTLIQQLMQNQDSIKAELLQNRKEMNGKFDQVNNRLEQLTQRVTKVEQQQSSSSYVRSSGQLPPKPVPNPKSFNVGSITLEDKVTTQTPEETLEITEDSDVQVGGSLPDKEVITNEDTSAWMFDHWEAKWLAKKQREAEFLSQSIWKDSPEVGKKEEVKTISASAISPTRESSPEEAISEESESDKSIYDSDEEFVAQCRLKYGDKFLMPDLVTPNLPKIKKVGDPGVFGVTCSIGDMSFPNSMCDLGAAISVMSVHLVLKLGLTNFRPGRVCLKLADQSTTDCLGILVDVPVVVDYIIVPTDFAVINMKEDQESPLLLGRPFLASTNALIDCSQGTVQLRFSEFRKPTYTMSGEILGGLSPYEYSDGSSDSLSEDDSDDEDQVDPKVLKDPSKHIPPLQPPDEKLENFEDLKIQDDNSALTLHEFTKPDPGPDITPGIVVHTRKDVEHLAQDNKGKPPEPGQGSVVPQEGFPESPPTPVKNC